jgi:hypothetical protein
VKVQLDRESIECISTQRVELLGSKDS